jgi:hypothetical protein
MTCTRLSVRSLLGYTVRGKFVKKIYRFFTGIFFPYTIPDVSVDFTKLTGFEWDGAIQPNLFSLMLIPLNRPLSS